MSTSKQYDQCEWYLEQGSSLSVAKFAAWFGGTTNSEWVKEKDEDGRTLLHYGMKHKVPVEVIRLLLKTWSDGAKETDEQGRTPLHIGMGHRASPQAIKLLLEGWPAGVQATDGNGCTPLHIGIGYKASVPVIQLLLDGWPEGVKETTKDGRTPLHIGMMEKVWCSFSDIEPSLEDAIGSHDCCCEANMHVIHQHTSPERRISYRSYLP
jgi:hypothetical protein